MWATDKATAEFHAMTACLTEAQTIFIIPVQAGTLSFQ